MCVSVCRREAHAAIGRKIGNLGHEWTLNNFGHAWTFGKVDGALRGGCSYDPELRSSTHANACLMLNKA